MLTPRSILGLRLLPLPSLLLALALASPGVSSCTRHDRADVKAPIGDARFAAFVDSYFDARYRYRPTGGTRVGFHQYDGYLDDLSRSTTESRIRTLHAQLDALLAFDREKLSFDETIDAQALEGAIRAELLDVETIREWERNPMPYASLAGGAIDTLMKRDFAPAAERLRSMTARLRVVPAIYVAARENLKTPPKEFTAVALRVARGSIGFFEKSVVKWVDANAADAHADDRAEFDKVNADAVAALRSFVDWLEKDLTPRSTGSYALGDAVFRAKLKYEDMIDVPTADLLARGEARLAKDYDAFIATAREIDPKKTAAEVMKSLSDDHPAEDDLIPVVGRSVEEARKFVVEHDLATIPSEGRPKVMETPPYARAGTFASMDSPGPFETKAKEAFYYVTPVEKDWTPEHKEEHLRLYNAPVAAMINVHEAWPGHYLQFLWVSKLPTKTRKLVRSSSNIEGWAHYAEQMMVEQGFVPTGATPAKARLAQLQEALIRDCRYVVGVRLHTAGLSVEDGAKIFVEKAFMEPANAYEESRRGAWNPTYLVYTLGKLEIQTLAGDYRKARGGTLKAFHDAFVAQGPLPIPLVRRILLQ